LRAINIPAPLDQGWKISLYKRLKFKHCVRCGRKFMPGDTIYVTETYGRVRKAYCEECAKKLYIEA